MARDDDGRQDAGGSPVGGEPFDWEHFVVPDDARELDADVRAYHREQRATARRRRVNRLMLWNKYGLAAPIALVLVFMVITFSTLLVVFPKPRTRVAGPMPLAQPAAPPGTEGGLVPDVEITRDGGATPPLRSLRPAVLMLLPEGCDCTTHVQEVARAAQRQQLLTILIGQKVPEHPDQVPRANVIRAADSAGRLASVYKLAADPVLVLVRADGVVKRILTGVPSDSALSSELITLDQRPRD